MGPRIDTERLMLRLPEMADAENGAGTSEAEVDGFRSRLQILW